MRYETKEAILDYLWMLTVAVGAILFVAFLTIGMVVDYLLIKPYQFLSKYSRLLLKYLALTFPHSE